MCICEFATECDGSGWLQCDGCGGDQCVCTCGGDTACLGCIYCLQPHEYGEDEALAAELQPRRGENCNG